jgi:hypothetical protein
MKNKCITQKVSVFKSAHSARLQVDRRNVINSSYKSLNGSRDRIQFNKTFMALNQASGGAKARIERRTESGDLCIPMSKGYA